MTKQRVGLFMDSRYHRAELDAVDKKSNNPDEVVICPRCGKELVFITIGNSYEVKCPTEDCLEAAFRGL